ncbi:MAG: NifU family protein [Chitinophagales bacterium]|nr:MAG: NifU family protein [Chitinophagales bacterium]
MNKQLWNKVDSSLNTIRPYLQRDGGDVEIVEITEDLVVRLRLVGACETCPQSFMTMKTGIEESIRRDVPQIKAIEAVNSGC